MNFVTIFCKIARGLTDMATEVTSQEFVDQLLPVRDREAHKGMFGRVLLLCGSVGFTGAAAMAAKAALRTGSGLIFLGVPERIYPILAVKLDAPMVFPLPDDGFGRLSADGVPEILWRLQNCDACLIGPGLGRSADILTIVKEILGAYHGPVVLDADGINALDGHIDVLRGTDCPIVLTPHEGEFTRLGGQLQLGRQQAALQMAQETGAVVLLKGHRTVITDGVRLFVNQTGNPGMAVGGSGDVLSGILVSLLGQGLPALEVAAAAAWLHGAAGDLGAKEIGEYGLAPEDLICRIPRLLK